MTAIAHWQIVDESQAGSVAQDHCWQPIWHDGLGLSISRYNDRSSERFRLRFDGSATFDVIPTDRLIVSSSAGQDVPQSTLDHLLADQIEPRVLAHEGELVVHASAIKVGGQSVLFVGNSGAGKSTLAASFDRAGFPLLGDDAVIVEQTDTQATARVLYPSLRLLPDSLAALFPSAHPSAAVAHYGSKRRLSIPIDPENRCEALEIGAIFALRPEGRSGQIDITPMRPADICMLLVSNSFALNPTDFRLAAQKLRKASIVANRIPAFELAYPRDFNQLRLIHDAVLTSLATPNREH